METTPTITTEATSSLPTVPLSAEGTENIGLVESPLSSTPFSQLAKKEAELVRNRRAFKKEQEQLSSEKEKLHSIQKTVQLFEETKKNDPVAALKMIGFSETDIFNYMAAQDKKELTPEEKAVQAATEATENRIKAFEESQQKRLLEEREQKDNSLIQGFKSELAKTIQADKDTYEYCTYYGSDATDLAYEITLAVVKESQGREVLSPSEAIKLAEEYFEQRDLEMQTLKKRQVKQPIVEKTEPVRTRTVSPPLEPEAAPKPLITRQRTLTNAATAIGTKPLGPETREQKRDRIIAKYRNG